MNKSNELLLRLQLLLSDQIQNLQKYKSFPNADVYKDAYMEVMKLIPLLNEIPNVKLVALTMLIVNTVKTAIKLNILTIFLIFYNPPFFN